MKMFGSGTLIGKTSDTVPQAITFGTLQDVTLDFTFTVKELYGSKQFPDDIGRGSAKITGKAKNGVLDADLFGRLFFNAAPTVGQILAAINEAATVPATTPFTHIVTNGAQFSSDEGVFYSATGIRFNRVASAPAIGEYSVDETTGTYTFASADANAAVLINYVYTSATGGSEFTITSNLLGDAPQFSVLFNGKRNGKQVNIQLNRCISSKLSLGTKLEDFTIPEFDFNAMADDSGTVGKMSFTS